MLDFHGYFQLRIEAQAGEVACPRSWAGSVEAWALRLLGSSGHCNPCRWSLQETQTHPFFSMPCNFHPGLMEKTLPSLLDLNSNICSKHLWVWGYTAASLPSNSPSISPWRLTLLPLCVVMAGVGGGCRCPCLLHGSISSQFSLPLLQLQPGVGVESRWGQPDVPSRTWHLERVMGRRAGGSPAAVVACRPSLPVTLPRPCCLTLQQSPGFWPCSRLHHCSLPIL